MYVYHVCISCMYIMYLYNVYVCIFTHVCMYIPQIAPIQVTKVHNPGPFPTVKLAARVTI